MLFDYKIGAAKMSKIDMVIEATTSIYSGFIEMLTYFKTGIGTVLEVNHTIITVLLKFFANFFSTLWAVLSFIYVVIYTLLVCVVDFLLELLNFLTAFLYLLWKILILVWSFLDVLFRALECLIYFMWTGGKWTAHAIQVSLQNLSDNGLSTWKYFVLSLKEFTNSVVGGFTTIGVFSKSVAVFLYHGLCSGYDYTYELILYTDFIVRHVCRYCFESSYNFVTEYILKMPREAYLGIVISCLVYVILKNLIHLMCSEGFTFPVTGWFSSSLSDEYDSEYDDYDRGEFSDDEEVMNYTLTANDEEENDEYSINSEYSDDEEEESSDSDEELEIDSDSDNESNAASESEMSEINIDLPQPDGRYGPRRSTTPSRLIKGMSADDLQKVIDDEKERRMCVVCQDRSKSVLILPCRHMCLCVECGNQIARSRSRERRKCPLCRSKINTIMNVYI